jgi:hypothetical protein
MARRPRVKKRTPETPESKAFRLEMRRADRREAAARLVAQIGTIWLEPGLYIADDADPEKISELCHYGGCWVEGALVTLAIQPTVNVAHHDEFDRALCAAGLKRFVRPQHLTDDDLGVGVGAVLVEEIQPGVRARMGFRPRESE